MEMSIQHLERELVSREKSMQFMQQEHSKILDALHQEIANLTKKCSGKNLKFRLF